jgi:hypothetical protein
LSLPAPTATFEILSTSGRIQGQVTRTGDDGATQVAEGVTVEIAGWPALNTTSQKDGYYSTSELPAGLHFVAARSEFAYSSWQPVQVFAGQTANADLLMLGGTPIIIPGEAVVQTRLDGEPAVGAYVWVAGSNEVRLTNEAGRARFSSYRFNPIIATYQDRWGIAEPGEGESVEIDLAYQGAPPLPEGATILPPEDEPRFDPFPGQEIGTLEPPVLEPAGSLP